VPNAAQTVAAPVSAAAAEVGLLGLVAELRDAAHDDGVNSEQLAQFCGAGGVGAVGVGEVLLRHDFVQSLALNDGEGAVLDQIGHQQVGDALAHIHIGAKQGIGGSAHGSIVKVQHCNAGPARRGGLGADRRRRQPGREGKGNYERENEALAIHGPSLKEIDLTIRFNPQARSVKVNPPRRPDRARHGLTQDRRWNHLAGRRGRSFELDQHCFLCANHEAWQDSEFIARS